jgi:hypothetical protein
VKVGEIDTEFDLFDAVQPSKPSNKPSSVLVLIENVYTVPARPLFAKPLVTAMAASTRGGKVHSFPDSVRVSTLFGTLPGEEAAVTPQRVNPLTQETCGVNEVHISELAVSVILFLWVVESRAPFAEGVNLKTRRPGEAEARDDIG